MKKLLIEALVGITLIGGGFFLWNQRLNFEEVDSQPPAPAARQQVAKAPVKATLEGQPDNISIPSLNMSLPVINGYYNKVTEQWNLTLNEVQYATITPPPNNAGGNTFFYGHYRPEVFAYLHLIKIGAQAIVTTTNGHTFTYQLATINVVSPTDDSLFAYQGPPILTVQTCTGLFFQNRELFVFNLVGAV
jgi:LPXTG-site transpeptidase (sortase) family protein